MRIAVVSFVIFLALISVTSDIPVCAAESPASERVLAVKAVMAESQAVLRDYEWLETTIISIDGDERSRERIRCYYDATGVFKTEYLRPPVEKPGINDLRFRVPVEKRENLTGEMERAIKLIKQYIPLNPNGLQAVTDNSKLSFSETDPGKLGRLTIRDFLKRGDRVELDLDLNTNRPITMKIFSYYELQTDSVTLSVTFGSLYGTATFAREVVLQDREKKLKVTVQNSNYNKTVQ